MGGLEGLVGREMAESSGQVEASCSRTGKLHGYMVVRRNQDS